MASGVTLTPTSKIKPTLEIGPKTSRSPMVHCVGTRPELVAADDTADIRSDNRASKKVLVFMMINGLGRHGPGTMPTVKQIVIVSECE